MGIITLLVLGTPRVGRPEPALPTGGSTLKLEPCLLRDESKTRSVSAKCGRLEVPEDYDRPDGKTLSLKVAVIPALRKIAEPDAFTQIAGGPGGASTEDYVSWGVAAFADIRKERDIVLVDQRGTGDSNPLRCPVSLETLIDIDDPAEMEKLSRECLESLPGDPRHYTTTNAVRDLDKVREALGYTQLNVYGVSYGSRVALEYLRTYSDRVRTLVIDGVVAADQALGPDIPLAAQRALDLIFDRCAVNDACNSRYPSIKKDFRRLYDQLKASPREVTFRDPSLGTPKTIKFSETHLAGVVRLMSYSAATAALLPLTIDRAANQDDLSPLAGQFTMVLKGLRKKLADGLHNAVVCTEDTPFINLKELDTAALEATYLGTQMIEELNRGCAEWPKGTITDDFKTPVTSGKPVLLLSGEADPVTPPSNADRALKTLSNGHHIVVNGHGHGVAPLPCVREAVAAFVSSASAANINKGCLAKQIPSPFFLSASGPAP